MTTKPLKPTSDEQKVLAGRCPDCDAADLHSGPEGGFSTNFACFSCSSRFNGTFVQQQVLFFERVGKISDAERPLFSVSVDIG